MRSLKKKARRDNALRFVNTQFEAWIQSIEGAAVDTGANTITGTKAGSGEIGRTRAEGGEK